MKRIFVFLIALSFVTYCNARGNGVYHFEKTSNCQFDNVLSYLGETLYLVPLTGSDMTVGIFNEPMEHYHNFYNYDEIFESMYGLSPASLITQYQYKYNPYSPLDDLVAGTHKRHIEGHSFFVKEIVRFSEYPDMWALGLVDLETGTSDDDPEIMYVYNSDKVNTQIDFENFPFVVESHFNYLKSLIGTKLVFATNEHAINIAEYNVPAYWNTFKTDINTGETIHYTTPYVKWAIKDVILDVKNSAIAFIVTDGKHTTKVIYDNPYTKIHPSYNVGNRVFPEKQWNELVAKYGEHHMSLIMQTKVTNDMTMAEKYMAGGRRLAGTEKTLDDITSSIKSNKKEVKEFGQVLFNATKESVGETLTGIKEVSKEIIKAFW